MDGFIRVVCILACVISGSVAAQDNSSRHEPQPYMQVEHPDWTHDAVIYQLNTRQFTKEGTFAAAMEQLPRLAELGIDIIWLMPIHPIGEKNRKGTLGSPYSVKDYRAVNPEFGTFEDFRAFVDAAHALDMKVILDWVANHTAWDHPWVETNPEWYERDWSGDFRPTPWWDWSDIIDLDFSHPELRREMADAMAFWVREADIDGFRCDVAGYVPLDFWETVRVELEAIKPVFMLAEWDQRDAHVRAFDATYAWGWNNAMHAIAMGEADTGALYGYYSGNESAFPRDAYRLMHVSNHDQNSWEGAQFERFGDALKPAIVLSVTGDGIPMIYNGQEAGNEKRLEFFEDDPIAWREHPIGDLYKTLFALKKSNRALWNGAAGAPMVQVLNSRSQQVFSFVRRHDNGDAVFVVLNLSDQIQPVEFGDGPHKGAYTELFSGDEFVFGDEASLDLQPWGYSVFVHTGD